MLDVAIVGAGPIGLYLAKLLKDFKIGVIDSATGPGLKPCSGLVSERFSKIVPIKKKWLEERISGAVAHCGGQKIRIDKNAFLIDRAGFHRDLAKDVDVKWSCPVRGIKIKRGFAEIFGKNELESKIVVGADGANSIVSKHWGFMKKSLVGVMGYAKEKTEDDFVHVWPASEGFFWKIPRTDIMEYGMLAKQANIKHLQQFFGLDFEKVSAAPVPSGPVKSFFNRTILVGDAAGHVKPWSGGGLVWGLVASKIAADVIKESLEVDDFSESFLSKYEKGWQALLGQDMAMGLLAREILYQSKRNEIENIFKKMSGLKIGKLDMDFPFSSLFNHLPLESIMNKA